MWAEDAEPTMTIVIREETAAVLDVIRFPARRPARFRVPH
jgi:hypothetical protein